MPATLAADKAIKCLIVSGVNITRLPERAPGEQPERDYAALSASFDAAIVDSENYRDAGGHWARLVDRTMGQKWGVAAAAVERARELGVEAILAMNDDIGVPLGVLLQVTRTRIPYVMIGQHMMGRRPEFFLRRLHMYGAYSQILALAEDQTRFVHEQYGVPLERLTTIYWYTDHHFYSPLPHVPVKRQVCSAGMTSRDYRTLIEATRGLDVQVKIEAHSAWFNNGVNFTPEMLHDRFEVCSYGTSRALRDLYAESAIVALPLQDVPFIAGYSTLLEGMAMGKPVVATRIKLIGDFIKDGWNGFLVRPGDPEHMRERIQFLLDNPDEAQRIGENARRTIEERFTLDHFRASVVGQVSAAVRNAATPKGSHHPVGV
ncbi:MAG TPA: glycosyltransferase family 4 protein [Chloroflexaceae bacterium]|nr:glycosyltransferase family 4 protein [Chloroflexaceae bacterium]